MTKKGRRLVIQSLKRRESVDAARGGSKEFVFLGRGREEPMRTVMDSLGHYAVCLFSSGTDSPGKSGAGFAPCCLSE